MKDFENIKKIKSKGINVEVYSNNKTKSNIKLIIKNGSIYIDAGDKKIEAIEENSSVELVNAHSKKIDKSIYEKYEYNLDKISDKTIKTKYSSIFGLAKFFAIGVNKLLNYSVIKKILLVGYFAASMFIVYAICNIAGCMRIEDTDFITMNKNYLQVENTKLSVNNFLNYERLEDIDYILPGDSKVSFKIKFDDCYQTAQYTLELEGSLTSLDVISESTLSFGRRPDNEYEIVVDKMVIDNLTRSTMGKYMGIKNVTELLNKKIFVDNLNDFTIVGIVEERSPSIYVNKDMFINILNNVKKGDNLFGGHFFENEQEGKEDIILDYNLYLEDIKLIKGRMPENDYEVIVNNAYQYEMKLNKTIKTKVNEKELKIVGYYDSKINRQDYLVNSNTVKYNVISKANGFMIYPKNEANVMNKFKNEYAFNIFNKYEKDKEEYISRQKEKIVSSIIFASIIFGISLIEIYLMIRASFLSRIKEIGVLRAIGMKKLDICKMFLGEIFAITTFSSVPRNNTYDIHTKKYYTSSRDV